MRVLRACAFVVAAIASLNLLGCLDIVHHITRDYHGNTVVYARLTFSRLLLEMIPEENLPNDDLCSAVADNSEALIPQSATEIAYETAVIDTELECGVSIRYAGTDRVIGKLNDEMADDTAPLIPMVESDRVTIRFPDWDLDLDESSKLLALAIMANAKYQLRISKTHFPTVRRALYQTDGGSFELEIDIQDYGDLFVVELPLFYWMLIEEDALLVVDR